VLSLSPRQQGEHGLLLAGVMLNAFCGAVILFLMALAKPHEIGSIMFWFMGNLGGVTLSKALACTAILLPGLGYLLFSSHSMNVLLLGHDAAVTLGLPAQRVIYVLLAVTSLMVSGLVAVVGPLGFVGLVVPQALRLVAGADNKTLVPASMLFGAAFLILCDLAARTLPPEGELPVGVITALVGAPVFIFLLRRGMRP
jgi:iron complex transport system permease protein